MSAIAWLKAAKRDEISAEHDEILSQPIYNLLQRSAAYCNK